MRRKTTTNPLAAARTLPDGRRAIPADAAVEWAFCQELPKSPEIGTGPMPLRTGYGSILDYGELGTVIDRDTVNRFGCVADLSADAFPDADAVTIGEAVLAMADEPVVMPEDWDPAPELAVFGGLGAKAVADAFARMTVTNRAGETVLRLSVADLVARRAILPVDPDETAIGDIAEDFERHANGKERWFVRREMWAVVGSNPDGSDRLALETYEASGTDKNHRILPGAYRKPFLDPDPVPAIIARAEHEIWHSALTVLAGDLDGALERFVVLPPLFSARPWEEAEDTAPRILPDLTSEQRLAELRDGLMRRRFPAWFARMDRRSQKTGLGASTWPCM